MTGIQQITAEFKRVRQKPGRSKEADYLYNKDGQLINAALTLINNDLDYYPDGWSFKFKNKIKNYTYGERLVIAGMFLAAEIDRYETYLDNIEKYAKKKYKYKSIDAKAYRNCGGWDNFFTEGYTPEQAVDEDMSCA